MFPTLSLGRFTFPTAGLVYILGIYLALSLVEQAARRRRLNHVALYNLATYALLAGFVGARLTFVLTHWDAYQSNWLGIIWPLNSGYNAWGGLLLAALTALFYARSRRLAAWDTLDALTPGLIFGLMIISLADFVGGPGLGEFTTVPWALPIHGALRHPVQLYEIMAGLAALGVWLRLADQPGPAGRLALLSVAVYCAGRLLTDAYRANTPLTLEGYHIVQIVCLIILLTALGLAARLGRPVTPAETPPLSAPD